MKKIIFALILSLLISPSVYSQALINIGTPVISLNANNAAAPQTGAYYALPVEGVVITWITSFATQPTSHTTQLQLSNDATTWVVGDTTTLITGESRTIITAARFIRTVETARSGGTSITTSISVGRGSIASVQSNPTVPMSASQYLGGIGTAAAPTYSYSLYPDKGFYSSTTGTQGLSLGGILRYQWAAAQYSMLHDSAALAFGSASDVILTRDATDVLAQRRGTTAQTFRVYNTYIGAADYERFEIVGDATYTYLRTTNAGTGTARGLALGAGAGGTARWLIPATGHFLAQTDNIYDIGASGGTRPRNIYVGTSVIAPAYTVGATPGATGTCSSVTVVNGIVTVCTP